MPHTKLTTQAGQAGDDVMLTVGCDVIEYYTAISSLAVTYMVNFGLYFDWV